MVRRLIERLTGRCHWCWRKLTNCAWCNKSGRCHWCSTDRERDAAYKAHGPK